MERVSPVNRASPGSYKQPLRCPTIWFVVNLTGSKSVTHYKYSGFKISSFNSKGCAIQLYYCFQISGANYVQKDLGVDGESNPGLLAWQARILPLNHQRQERQDHANTTHR